MASSTSTEASEIRRRGRQRLIGAIALVMHLVVFVPMLLDSEPRPARDDPVVAIPSRENVPPLPAPTPLKAGSEKAQGAAPALAAPKPAATVETGTPAQSGPLAGPGPLPPAADSKAAPAKLEGFAVQVGAFRDEAKLRQAREKLVAAGIAHYTERLEAASGPLTRLRAGPFATREAAEGALAALKRAGLDAKVVPLP